LWEFLSLQSNVSELGLDLDDMYNFPYTKEKCKALKANISFVLDHSKSENSNNEGVQKYPVTTSVVKGRY
jgi:hypothetical protein